MKFLRFAFLVGLLFLSSDLFAGGEELTIIHTNDLLNRPFPLNET